MLACDQHTFDRTATSQHPPSRPDTDQQPLFPSSSNWSAPTTKSINQQTRHKRVVTVFYPRIRSEASCVVRLHSTIPPHETKIPTVVIETHAFVYLCRKDRRRGWRFGGGPGYWLRRRHRLDTLGMYPRIL